MSSRGCADHAYAQALRQRTERCIVLRKHRGDFRLSHAMPPNLGREIVPNPFVHVELNAADPKKAKEFYAKLFDWQLEDMSNPATPDEAYTVIKVGTGTGGGIMKQVPGGPAGWLAYVSVDDIHAATQKAKSLGGKVMKEVTEVPGMGWFSFIQDPNGAILGLWKNRAK
jgi:predicted enzyme related to lactoylglutathione lyase